MIHLAANEKIILVLHRHWVVMLGKIIISVVLLFMPVIAVPLVGFLNIPIGDVLGPVLFGFAIYLMIVMLMIFMFWIEYYLDMWVITTERVIDIEQKTLFNREVSEFHLKNVQDVTVEIPGFLATFLKFGNIIIQTAGERSFSIRQIPKVYEAKNLILDYSKRLNGNGAIMPNNSNTPVKL